MDLLGLVRSKLVPSAAIRGMQKVGAGFAGYAAHFNMTVADPDVVFQQRSRYLRPKPCNHLRLTHCSHPHPHPTPANSCFLGLASEL